jgi:hypothetical protein
MTRAHRHPRESCRVPHQSNLLGYFTPALTEEQTEQSNPIGYEAADVAHARDTASAGGNQEAAA